MKNLITYTLAASLAAGAAAHQHHAHLHERRHAGSKVVKREPDVVTEYVVAATETVYQLGGKIIDSKKAKAGIKGGNLVVVGETKPTYTPPKPATTSSAVNSATLGAQFIESETSTSTTPTPTPTTTSTTSTSTTPTTTSTPTTSSTPIPTTSTPAAATTSAAIEAESTDDSSSSSSSSSSSGTGLTSEFPSGKIKCSEFPSDYGAVALDWLNFGGWSGLQFVPGYSTDATSISDIVTGIAGQTCSEECMCSYACPPGYQKTQWPTAQGSTSQSIGGLYCNSDGYLELTRSASNVLCEAGVGGVTIQNDLDEVVATCRTDYPGTESMVVPAIAEAGATVSVCNPDQENYYIWEGSGTSAQYYVNKKGYTESEACVWTSSVDSTGAGNWAPIILGVGKASDGTTYISLFQNLPTSDATLDFSVEITGDVSTECSYIDGVWSSGSDTGCTTGMPSGGSAVVRYFSGSS